MNIKITTKQIGFGIPQITTEGQGLENIINILGVNNWDYIKTSIKKGQYMTGPISINDIRSKEDCDILKALIAEARSKTTITVYETEIV